MEVQGVGSQILLGIQAKGKYYHNLSLGFTTKARGLEKCGPKVQPGSHIHNLGSVGEHEEMSHTLPNGLPLWELESRWISKFFLNDLRGQNLLNLKVPYTIEIFWGCRCQK